MTDTAAATTRKATGSSTRKSGSDKDDGKDKPTILQNLIYAEVGAAQTLLKVPFRVFDSFRDEGEKAIGPQDDDDDQRDLPERFRLAASGLARSVRRGPQSFFDWLVEQGEKADEEDDD